jgi:hypothetical protein
MKKIQVDQCKHEWVPGCADRGVRYSRPSLGFKDRRNAIIPMEGWDEFEAHLKTVIVHCPTCFLERYNGKNGKKRYFYSVRNQAIKNPKFLLQFLVEIYNHPNPSVFKNLWMDAISGAYFTANLEIPSVAEVQKFMRLEKEGQKDNKK